ncbi:MAG: alpha-mannosidase [Clostridia bacterium]|nr:alpha-mannosidase [Clostridia bacterium]
MTYLEKLRYLDSKRNENKASERIVSQIVYLDAISKYADGRYDSLIENAADYLIGEAEKEGAITNRSVQHAENMLAELVPVAKSYKELFIGHAHIDMNWQWSYNETAAITVDTFRTMLDIMNENPDFTFGQSQASTYEIIEKHCPELLDEIKKRIHEGRWIVTAAEWVEPDKNMPDGESLTRQILQARKYLSGLLEIDPSSLDLDFVPDSFGHNINAAEILANAGVKYMYHWRGGETNPRIYWYVSPSGKRVLTYREYVCYAGSVSTERFEIVPEFAHETGLKTYICVFGVGDHGGGPTRRDIERIEEYRTWPLTPTIEFGTYGQFFREIESSGIEIPEVTSELNFLFTGCYTSQARIKMANRFSEARINDAEQLSSAASILAGAKREPGRLDRPWRNILFSHFHDILPGSGVLETREHALGKFQETLADVNIYASSSMRKIAAEIDTTSIPFVHDPESISEGSGAGFRQSVPLGWNFANADTGNGPVRGIHLFNTTGYDRDEFVKLVIWNYAYDLHDVVFLDPDGNELEYCIEKLNDSDLCFWNNYYCNYMVRARVPAFGYTTIYMKPRTGSGHLSRNAGMYMRGDSIPAMDCPVTLENEKIAATFDSMTMELTRLLDKETGTCLIDRPSCFFELIQENARGMTSWVNGQIANIKNLNREAKTRILRVNPSGPNAFIDFIIEHGKTFLSCCVSLKKLSSVLEFTIHAYWTEETEDRKFIPQLRFAVPVSYETDKKGWYDIPYGTLVRDELPHDVPALSYIGIGGNVKNAVGIVTDTKYGYRLWDNEGSVDLIRTSYDPDVFCDRGNLLMKVGVMVAPLGEMKKESILFNHPVAYTSATRHTGSLPLSGRAVIVTGDVKVSCVKNSEDGLGTAIRIYDDRGTDQKAEISLASGITQAFLCDSNENILSSIGITDGRIQVQVPANDFITLLFH